MDLAEPGHTPEMIERRLEAFLAEEDQQAPVGPMLAFDGCDHAEWDPAAYEVIRGRMAQEEGPYDFVHGTLDDYLAGLQAVKDEIGQVMQGELREPGLYPGNVESQWLIPGVDSSRVRIKQANAACERMLTTWAEPLSSYAHAALNLPYPSGYLNVAWRWLLKNHPHDSICGCSIDEVHQDMFFRFHQSAEIADRLSVEATRKLGAAVTGEVREDELRVVVFNPLATRLDEVAVLDLEIPVDWPGYGEMTQFETRPGFRVYGPDGVEAPYQRLGQMLDQARFRIFDTTFPRGYRVNVVKVALPVRIPALGYTTLSVRPGEAGMPTRAPQQPNQPGLMTGTRKMENEFLRVVVEQNGTLTMTDKRSGSSYRDLLTFEDSADIGDGWNYGPAANDQVYLSSACHTDIALAHSGPSLAAFRIRTRMDLPAAFDFGSHTRSARREALLIDSLVTLKAGAEQVEVETTVYNNIEDHRLRVLFPSGASEASTYLADTPFDVVERSIALRADNHLYREPEVETKPQQNFTVVFQNERGLAVISPGLYESAVQDTPERTIGLTLFRATRRTVMTNGQPGGQVQGELVFRYAVRPLAGAPERSELYQRAALLGAGLRAAQLRALDVKSHRSPQLGAQPLDLPTQAGFVTLEGRLALTSLRRTEAGLEIRVFNPNDEPVTSALSLAGWPAGSPRPTQATWVNFESQPVAEPLTLAGDRLSFEVQPKQIRTLCLE